MTQNEMVAALDGVLERWRRARAILAELEPELRYVPAEAGSAEVSRVLVQQRAKLVQVELPAEAVLTPPLAIQNRVPAGPVFVSAAAVAGRRAAVTSASPAADALRDGSLEALVRELADRAS